MRHIVRLWIFAGVFFSIPISASAQAGRDFSRLPDSQPTVQYHVYDKKLLTFSTSVQFVLVPVIVTDKSGRAVTGLTKEDFRVKENGKEQQLASLDEFISSSMNSKESPHPTNQNPAKQLIIIAFDVVNTPIADQTRARNQLAEYFKGSLDQNCQYGLVSVENNGVRVLHDYRQDPGTLVAALQASHNAFPTTNGLENAHLPKPSPMDIGGTIASRPGNSPIRSVQQAYAQSLEASAASSTLLAFQEIAAYVRDIPGRKSLIWVTAGFPFAIEPDTGAVNLGVPSDAYEQTMHLLSSQMISVYSVDARGLVMRRPHEILDTMRIFSAMTGGRAYLNTNDIRGAVSEAVADGSAYYLLSYPLDKTNQREGWRKISVKAGKYQVRARSGYLMTNVVSGAQNF